MASCPFCSISSERARNKAEKVLSIRDQYPVSKGHTLIIPTRHIQSFFDIDNDEREQLLELLNLEKEILEQEFNPDGFNIGINDGEVAGQTIAHLHIHLIPRYRDDVPDPKGGVRWVIPDKAKYWD